MLCMLCLCKNAKKSFMYFKNSENTHFGQFSNDTLLFYANRNKAEPREVTKQVVWIILRNRIFHRTIRHIRSGFLSYGRTLCALTLFAYALNTVLLSLFKEYSIKRVMSREIPAFGFPTRSEANYLNKKNKGANQSRGYFCIC